MRRRKVATIVLMGMTLGVQVLTADATETKPWWLRPQRMLQTNLREIDATMDLDRYVREVKAFGANVVLFNVGGIVANYPTDLQFHWRNAFMKGDLVGAALERLHREDLRVIGRFDFSKINETFAARHPEWLYVSEKGENVNYNGQVHTCVSGGYQQEYMLKILGEAMDRYPLDGVFFNMIGYTRSDYSGNYHGLCQCDNCKRLFAEYSGMELPATRDDNSPVYRKYVEFTRMMSDKQFHRVNAFLKARRPDLAICTYTSAGVDVIRKESNRPLGQGTYYDTGKAKWTLLTCGQRQLANCAVHFIDIPFRHAAVSPYLTVRRVWQQMVNGAWLDFYCIGPLQRQEDRTGLDLTAGLYDFHARNERWLLETKPAAQVVLMRRGGAEYEGLLQILSENQVAFELTRFEDPALRSQALLIVPEAGALTDQQCGVLDRYVAEGGRLLLTGKIPAALKCLQPVHFQQTRPAEKASYIRIRPDDRQRLE
ncbi:MAG: family 10 glycosylhydrolase, partial [Phycisphaerales bacterium]